MNDIVGLAVVVEEAGKAPFQVRVTTGSSTFTVDEPVEAGGQGGGPNPYDLLSAAIGSCSLLTMRMYAQRKQWPLQRVRVNVTHRRAGVTSKDEFAKEIHLFGELSDEQRARLLDISKRCPVHLTIERGSTVTTVLAPRAIPLEVAADAGAHMRHMGEACEDD